MLRVPGARAIIVIQPIVAATGDSPGLPIPFSSYIF